MICLRFPALIRAFAWRAVWCLALLLPAAVAPAAERGDFIAQRAVWQDCGGAADWAAARAQSYVPYQGALSLGYGDCVDWVRLRIEASSGPLVLRMTPYWIDEITLFDPAGPGPAQTVGDRYPRRDAVLAGLAHVFVLPAGGQARDVWLRLSTASAHRLAVQALTVEQAGLAAARQMAWASLYTAVLLLLLLLLAAIWWGQRDAVLGTYLVRLACYALYGAGYLGLPQVLLAGQVPPQALDAAFSFAATAMLPAGVLFDVVFLSHYGARRAWLGVLAAIGLFGVVLVGVLLAGYTRLALELNIQALMVGNVVVTLAAFACRPSPAVRQLVPRSIVLGYYLFTFGSLLLGLVTMLGWEVARPEWMGYSLIVHGMVSALMMTAILVARGRRIASRQLQMAWQLDKARQDVLVEQQRREEQSRFLHMLMHELKTPLSILAMALGARERREENLRDAGRAIRDMKAILDRCVQADRLGQPGAEPQVQEVDLPALVGQAVADVAGLDARCALAVAPGLPRVRSDAQWLRTIVFNLLDNAARYGEHGAEVRLAVEPAARDGRAGARVAVANRPGDAGWPDAGRIFDKYYRAAGARHTSGSGLGLFLSRQLAQGLGGVLDYAPGAGHMEFVLWIPLNPD